MRRRTMISAAMTLATTIRQPATAKTTQAQAMPPTKGSIVLELFTSQGCSSCPPADALLDSLSREPAVIALAWHVDYWNSLGWRDPYASRLFTDRQRQYARLLGEEVYTPALVINGARMVVGSNQAAVRAAITEAARLPAAADITRDGETLTVAIRLVERAASALLVTYDALQVTAITAGENAGRRLRNARVVRGIWPYSAQPGRFRHVGIEPGQGAVLLLHDDHGDLIAAADSEN